MSENGEPKSPIDQLIDLFVYAPVGFLYEKDDLLDKVVTRGKSQVQLARLMAKMAAQQGDGPEAMVSDAIGFAADAVAKGITDFGVALGLVPPPNRRTTPRSDGPVTDVDEVIVDEVPADEVIVDDESPVTEADEVIVDEVPADEVPADETAAAPIDGPPTSIPGYDQMNARDIIAALGGRSVAEVEQVASYERANRNRKTILAKADRLRS